MTPEASIWEQAMTTQPTIGLDLAKNVFQVHGIDGDGKVIVRRQLRRADVITFFAAQAPSLVGMEACASAHFWAREIRALGHIVRLMPPAYVKPYVKRGKTDAADAEAICEGVTRPTMRFVAVKSAEQQALLMVHKARELLVRQRTMLTNALRAHLAEFGFIAAQGPGGFAHLSKILAEQRDRLPSFALDALDGLSRQIDAICTEISKLDARILQWHRTDRASQRLATIPGVGPITASAIAASVPDPSLFRSGRQFAAWLGLTPRPHSSGGKGRMLGISKQGDAYLRRLLVVGATAVLRYSRQQSATNTWAARMLERKRPKIVAVALANKTARIAWALLSRHECYVARPA
jgi:transposase